MSHGHIVEIGVRPGLALYVYSPTNQQAWAWAAEALPDDPALFDVKRISLHDLPVGATINDLADERAVPTLV